MTDCLGRYVAELSSIQFENRPSICLFGTTGKNRCAPSTESHNASSCVLYNACKSARELRRLRSAVCGRQLHTDQSVGTRRGRTHAGALVKALLNFQPFWDCTPFFQHPF